jgi:hypothetical protein
MIDPQRDFNSAMMLYMSAQNNLAAFADVNIQQIKSNEPLEKLLLYIMKDTKDGTLTYRPEDGSFTTNLDHPTEEFPTKNVTDPAVFERFLGRAAEQLPAVNTQQKLLVLWGHGGGIYFLDEDLRGTGRVMQASVPDFANALADRAVRLDPRLQFDVIIFDACYMGVIETINEFRGVTGFVLAATTVVDQAGLPYDEIVADLNGPAPPSGPVAAAKMIRDKYNSHYRELDPHAKRYLFLYDVKKLRSCVDALNILGDRLNAAIAATGENKELLRIAAGVASTHPSSGGFRDVLSFCDQLSRHFVKDEEIHKSIQEAAEAVKSSVRNAVSGSSDTLGEQSATPTAPVIWCPIEKNLFDRFVDAYDGLESSNAGANGWAKLWKSFHAGPAPDATIAVQIRVGGPLRKFSFGLGILHEY